MGSVPPPGFGDDDEAVDRDRIQGTQPGRLQRERLERRRARRGSDALPDAYDAANEKGVIGEERVGTDLERLLAGSECVLVHSIQFVRFGDIDHLVIGAGGITVIDAKNWTGTVTVRGLLPRVEGWTKPKEVEKLQRQLAGVRLALLHARPELRNTGVRGVMCLAAEPDRRAIELEDRLVLGGSAAAARIAARPGALTPDSIAHLRDVLIEHLPRITRQSIDELNHSPSLNPDSMRTPASHRAWSPGTPQRSGRPTRLRRSRRARGGATAAVVTIAAAAVAWWGIAHLRFVVPDAPGTVSHLKLARHGHRVEVYYTAAAGARVRVIVRGAGRTRRVELTAAGGRQSWTGPAIPRYTRRVQIRACVQQSTGRCGPSTTRTLANGHAADRSHPKSR